MKPMISVIIPTLNEEEHLPQTLAKLENAENLEIIVTDGGSRDRTVELAKARDAKVICAPPGRGVQLNHGVKASSGELLLFLHSDTILPGSFSPLIHQTLGRKNCVAGAFSLKIDSPKRSLLFIAYCANLRSRILQLPYGDQAFFTSRKIFDRMGGFPEVPLMEDYIFIKNIKKYGKIHTLDEAVLTSSRRWQNMGTLRTTLINQLIVAGYNCGVKLSTLACWYQRLKGVSNLG